MKKKNPYTRYTGGFQKAGLLRDEELNTSTNSSQDERDFYFQSDNESDQVILRLNSGTEKDDFSGFSAQEEDEDSISDFSIRLIAYDWSAGYYSFHLLLLISHLLF